MSILTFAFQIFNLLKRLFKISRNVLFLLLGIVCLLVILINLVPVQTFLSNKVASYLSDKLNTKVEVSNVRFHLLNSADIEGLYIQDRNKDTLLYAGNAELKITDWFIFKPKPVISFLGLTDAIVLLHRNKNSDVWNYQFIVDAFSSNKKSTSKQSTLNLDFKKAELNNVRFNMKDEWVGTDMGGSIGHLVLKAKNVDFTNKVIELNSLVGDQITFGLTQYTGGRPEAEEQGNVESIDTTAFNPDLWKVSLNTLQIKDNHFFIEYPETKAPKGLFDEDHLDITGIYVDAKNLFIQGDTITADLNGMQAKERCGLQIKNMKAQIKVSPNISECKNLYLETGNSVLTDYYAMKYKRFPDFLDYIDKVKMVGHLKDAEIGIQDIVYFAPDLKRFDQLSVKLSGDGNGTVAKLDTKNIILNDGFTELKGDLNFDGLPDINSTFIDFRNAHIKTTGAALLFYAPDIRSQKIANFKALSRLDFKGNFTGFISDFVAYGSFNTNLGNLIADVNMKLPERKLPQYSGSLSAENFDLGTFFYQDYAGLISFDATVNGHGFQQKDVEFDADGHISHFFINNYNYQDIAVNGKLKKNRFDGFLKANDPNLKMDFTGKIDFSRKEAAYDFFAKVDYINAKLLKLTDDSLSGNATLKANFKGNNIDNFLGNASIYDMNVTRDTTKLNLDSLSLVSSINSNNEKQLLLQSKDLYASVFGQFNLKEMPQSFQLFLSYYLPEYIKTPAQFNPNQNFKFEVKANSQNSILSLWNKHLRIGDSTHFTGSLDMGDQQLILNGTIPQFAFNKIEANNVVLAIQGTPTGLKVQLNTDSVKSGDDNIVSKIDFTTAVFRDSAQFKLITSSSDNNIEDAQLNGTASALKDSFYVNMLNSSFNLNKQNWDIPSGNHFVFAKKYFRVNNLKILSGKQQILINTNPKDIRQNSAYATVEQLDLSSINEIFGWDDFKFSGLLNGKLDIQDIYEHPKLNFDVTSNNLLINEDTIGSVNGLGSFDFNAQLLSFNEGTGIHYKDAAATANGILDFSNSANDQTQGVINFNNAQIQWAQPFLKDLVHDISGTLNGKIKVTGSPEGIKTSGQVDLLEAGFTPDIIGSHYLVKRGRVNVMPDGFDLRNLVVYDELGNQGICSGTINHKSFRNFIFDVKFGSDNMEVVNLKANENDHYYGKVFASFQARITGPFENLNVNVFATSKKNSSLIIPISYGTDLGTYGYIHFKKLNQDSLVTKPKVHNKINFRLDAVVNPDLLATIILDPVSGDRIVARGSGNIILDIPSDDEVKMNGNYNIDQGTYDFSFKQLQVLNYKRQFIINPNSTIKWNGDITDADLDVSAYATVKTRLYDLIQGEADRLNLSPEEKRDAQTAQNVNVLMKMKGSLREPDMKFNIELTEARSIGTYAYQKLQRINTDEKELLNQVASLLLLDQFVSEGITNTSLSSGTINNMSQLLSSAVSSQITNLTNKLLGVNDISIGLSYKNYSLSDQDPTSINYLNRNEAGLNLRKSFLNSRLTVEVGGVYDWGKTASAQAFQDNLAGDFRVQYLLSAEGKVRFDVFRNSSFDALSLQNISRQGVGINFRKSFNGFYDFFNIKRSGSHNESAKNQLLKYKDLKIEDSLILPKAVQTTE